MNIKVGVIVGSTRPGRAGRHVADWYMKQVDSVEGMEFTLVDLADWKLPLLDEQVPASAGKYENDHTKKWSEEISKHDAFVWVTSEYNHAPPASLLNAISYLYAEWNRKPLAFVGYGNMGGARAIEQLRAVAGELQMADIRQAIGIRSPWAMKDENGDIKSELISGDPVSQTEDLKWWADALRSAK